MLIMTFCFNFVTDAVWRGSPLMTSVRRRHRADTTKCDYAVEFVGQRIWTVSNLSVSQPPYSHWTVRKSQRPSLHLVSASLPVHEGYGGSAAD